MCVRLEGIESSLQQIRFQLGIEARRGKDSEGQEEFMNIGATESHLLLDAQHRVSEQLVVDGKPGVEIHGSEDIAGNEVDGEVAGKDEPVRMSASQRHLVEVGLGDLDLREEWVKMAHQHPAEAVAVRALTQRWSIFSRVDLGVLESSRNDRVVPWWILQPNGPFRTCWDITMLLIIAHDMAVIPITLAFQTGESVVSDAMFWPFLLFWTMDIPITFFTAFYRNGLLVVKKRWIAVHYLCTWFLFDCFMVSFSWVDLYSSMFSDGYLLARTAKSLRWFRIFRSIAILRLAKLRSIADRLGELITSEYAHILFGVLKLIVTIIWLSHFIACSWWAIGINMSDGTRYSSWTAFYEYEQSPLSLQYLTSLHWSLTQFTPASMDVSARNTPERIFSVIVLLFALIAFSSFVSSITAHMTHLRSLQDCHTRDFARLRRYLRSHQVPHHLSARIMYCVEYRVKKQMRQVQDSDVSFLKLLSKPLQRELAYHMFSPTLDWHPFFACCSEIDSEAVKRFCAEAVSSVTLAAGDLLFSEGEGCSQMFFLTTGRLRYSLGSRKRQRSERRTENGLRRLACRNLAAKHQESFEDHLDGREWCCEISIWCPWTHLGSMMASDMSEVMAVDAASVIRVTTSFHFVARLASRYAHLFKEKVLEALEEGDLVTDMSSLSADMIEDIVADARLKPASSFHSRKSSSKRESDSAARKCSDASIYI